MDSSIERNIRFLNRLNQYPNLNPIRISAITPNYLTNYKFIFNNESEYNSISDKEWSCLISHFKALHTAYHNNDEYIIIAEDDLIILNNINFNKLIKTAPNEWDILQTHHYKQSAIEDYINSSHIWQKESTFIFSTAMYIINRLAIEKIFKRFMPEYKQPWENIKILNFKSSNKFVADYLLYNNLNRYILTQPLFMTECVESTIHPDHIEKFQLKTNLIIKRLNKKIKT
jgi:GR25 family glycosyltransferase involved in LPS biosynthesis